MERRPSTSSTASSKSRNSERKGSAASTLSIYDSSARTPTSATPPPLPPVPSGAKTSKILSPGLTMSAIQENGHPPIATSDGASTSPLDPPPGTSPQFPNSKPRKRSKDATNNPPSGAAPPHQNPTTDASSLFSKFGWGNNSNSRPSSPEPSPTSDSYGASGSPTTLAPLSAGPSGRNHNGAALDSGYQPYRKLSAGNIRTPTANSLYPPEADMERRRSVDSLHRQGPLGLHQHPSSAAAAAAAAAAATQASSNNVLSGQNHLTTTPGGGIAHQVPPQRTKLMREIRELRGLRPSTLSTNLEKGGDSASVYMSSPTGPRPPNLRRSNSAEFSPGTFRGGSAARQVSNETLTNVPPKPKKRAFGIFSRKKSHTNLSTSSASLHSISTTTLVPFSLSPTSHPGPPSTIALRKHSNDTSYSESSTAATPAWEREEPDYAASVASGRSSGKKLSNKGSRRGIERSETSEIYYGKERDKGYGKRNSLTRDKEYDHDSNFDMNSILDNDDPTSFLNSNVNHEGTRFRDNNGRWQPIHTSAESWSPPESWAVQPAPHSGITMSLQHERERHVKDRADGASEYMEKEEEDDFREEEKLTDYRRTFTIRIWRADRTFATLPCPPNTPTYELVQSLGRKFFISDLTKYNLYVKRQKLERILRPDERPLQIQKQLLEYMGYTDQDKLEDLGREDNSYLVSFEFAQAGTPSIPAEEEYEFGNFKNVDLKARNLSTIPIFLYRKAFAIMSLDVSKNLMIQLPIDFIQMCTQLRELCLSNTELTALPPSISYIETLEHLDISCNRLRDLEHAKLDKVRNLGSLYAYNNRLETLPDGFARFTRMTKLHISNNSFLTFPTAICDIISLVELDVSFNKISCLPENIGQLVHLNCFLAVANQLTGLLPQSFANLVSLHELDIRQNGVTDLEVLSKLPALESLSVDYNAVSNVASEFKSLKLLRMMKNGLTQFDLRPPPPPLILDPPPPTSDTPPPIPEPLLPPSSSMLTDLNIASCQLSALPEEVFVNSTALEQLVLDNNFLTTIPQSIGFLQRLLRLSAQSNSLQNIPVEIAKLTELKTLDLQKNNLKTLPKEIWLCPSLQTLNCSSNLLESFPNPLSAPGVALNVALGSTADVIVTPNVAANAAAAAGNINGPSLGTNAGQGVVPMMTPVSAPSQQDRNHLSPSGNLANSVGSPPNFNPPSFFASPRNHPPPLSLSLKHLFLGDNRLTDDVFSPLSLFSELRTLNLAFNDLFEIPPDGLCHQHLYELYLSGNQLASLPADDIEKLSFMRVLHVNGNKLQTLPAELGKLRKLLVLDVGSNVLKYNIANWPYDWNWNWNLGLKYLNLSGNKRLEIKVSHAEGNNPRDRDLSNFSALTRLRVLGLMDVTIMVSVPEESHDRRVRTSPSEVNTMAYGMADWLGPNDHLTTWDLVVPRFRSRDDESLFGLFDGRKNPSAGCKVTKFLFDSFTKFFSDELKKLKNDDTIVSALRRTFLSLEKELGSQALDDKDSGASAVVCYISGTKLYVANVGDALAVVSRSGGQATEISQKHIPLNPSEVSRIRTAGGFVSNTGLLNGELPVSRSFGHFHLLPVVNANPYISTIELSEQDEFVILASKGLWERMSYQTAVDIARTEREDLMLAAQKLRDFAITYGAEESLMVMCIGVGDLFDRRDRKFRTGRGGSASGRGVLNNEIGMDETSLGMTLGVKPKDRTRKKDLPGDSILARLEREIAAPLGQVALCFTDIKNSTFLWETQYIAMRPAMKAHNSIMRRLLRRCSGYEVKTEGDAFMVCFSSVTSALLWCFYVQMELLQVDWPQQILDSEDGREITAPDHPDTVIFRGLSVRMGIHWGRPVCEVDPVTNRMDYFGPIVNRASRICSVADGGQICISSDVVQALGTLDSNNLSGGMVEDAGGRTTRKTMELKKIGFTVVEIGDRKLKGLETPETLSLIYPKALVGRIEHDKLKSQPATTLTVPNSVKEKQPDDGEGLVAQNLDPELIRRLGYICLRLERVSSGNVYPRGVGGSRASRADPMNGLLTFHVKDNAEDEELLRIMDHLVTRIENAANTLYLRKYGHFAKVLEQLSNAISLDQTHLIRALQMYAQVMSKSQRA